MIEALHVKSGSQQKGQGVWLTALASVTLVGFWKETSGLTIKIDLSVLVKCVFKILHVIVEVAKLGYKRRNINQTAIRNSLLTTILHIASILSYIIFIPRDLVLEALWFSREIVRWYATAVISARKNDIEDITP